MDTRPRRLVAGGLLPIRRPTGPQFPDPTFYPRRTGTVLSTTPTLSRLPPLSAHWAVPSNVIFASVYSSLCLVAVGKPHLKELWSDCNPPPIRFDEGTTKEGDGCSRCQGRRRDEPFQATQDRWKDKITTVTVVVRSLVTVFRII